eukprot:scaffold1600_cov229-Prasinococcus_capsulatus_cf.AAC.2
MPRAALILPLLIGIVKTISAYRYGFVGETAGIGMDSHRFDTSTTRIANVGDNTTMNPMGEWEKNPMPGVVQQMAGNGQFTTKFSYQELNAFPATYVKVALFDNNFKQGKDPSCGGSILPREDNPGNADVNACQWVLTAAHCIAESSSALSMCQEKYEGGVDSTQCKKEFLKSRKFQVGVGNTEYDKMERIDVDIAVIHDSFKTTPGVNLSEHDIALLGFLCDELPSNSMPADKFVSTLKIASPTTMKPNDTTLEPNQFPTGLPIYQAGHGVYVDPVAKGNGVHG